MKKIVEIIPSLDSGGAERFVTDFANQLSSDNVVILIIIQAIDSSWFLVRQLSEKIRVVSFNKSVGFSVKTLFRITRLLFKEKPDVVHTHLAAIYYIFLYAIFKKGNVKIVHTLHSAAMPEAEFPIGIKYRKFMFKRSLVSPVTISEESQNSFMSLYSLNSYLIPNGRARVEVARNNRVWKEICALKKTSSTKVFMNIASILDCKNQLMLAKSVKRVSDEGMDILLIMIGRKTDEKIVKMIEDLNCDRIAIIGERSNPLDYLFFADCFILTSKYEGMPISLIEAFSLGKVSICTPVGGILNMVQTGINGFLTKDISIDCISDLINHFLSLSENEIHMLEQRAKGSFSHYSISTCVNRYLKLF